MFDCQVSSRLASADSGELHSCSRTGLRRLTAIILSLCIHTTSTALADTTFSIEENTNYLGHDYHSFVLPTNDLYQCVEACRSDARCSVFSYVRPGLHGAQAKCWLRQAAPAKQADDCCISGTKQETVPSITVNAAVTRSAGLDYPGKNYRRETLDAADPKKCADLCWQDDACRAYTYVKPGVQGPAAICYLKSGAGTAAVNPCCTSGVKGLSPKALDDISLAAATDRPGSDYESADLAVPDPMLCAKACKGDPQCRAYTFVNPGLQGPQAKCWLKNNVPAAKAATGHVSGVKTPDTGVKSALTRGQPVSQSQSCSAGAVDDAFDLICSSGGALGLKCVNKNTPECSTDRRQIPVGSVAHAKVGFPLGQDLPMDLPGYSTFGGGRGRLLGEAAMCSLRELSPQFALVNGGKGGPITSARDASISLGKLTYKQTIGYLDFDPAAKLFKGYRQLSVCAPIVGCFDSSVGQNFTVKLDHYSISPPINLGVAKKTASQGSGSGNALKLPSWTTLDEFYALTIASDKTADAVYSTSSGWKGGKNVELWPPKITVATPAGPVSVQPKFKYHAENAIITAPYQNVSLYLRHADEGPGWPMAARLVDIYGADHGVAFPLTRPGDADGWQSSIALGNRRPGLTGDTWSPSGNPPWRPDRDLRIARSGLERNPSTELVASGRISFPDPGELAKYIPSWMPLSGLKFEIWVEPEARAAFSGQFDLIAAQADLRSGDAGGAQSFNGSDLEMLANAAGVFGFNISAGVNLVLKISVPIAGEITIIDSHPSFRKPLGEGNTFADTQSAYFASESKPLGGGRAYSQFKTFKADLGDDPNNAAESYVTACLAENQQVSPEEPPQPKVTPGDPRKLFENEFVEVPCNVCAYADKQPLTDKPELDAIIKQYGLDKSAHSHTFFPVQRPPDARHWECDMQAKSGCHDICRLHTKAGPDANIAPMTYLRGPDATMTIKNENKVSNGEVCHLQLVR